MILYFVSFDLVKLFKRSEHCIAIIEGDKKCI